MPTCWPGKTSRLYRALVYEQRVATEIAASQNSREIGSFFQIVATAAPGHTLADVERAIASELQKLTDTGPAEVEMERCLAQAEAHFIFRLQTVGGFGGKGDQLNAYNVFLGEPGFFERIWSATAAPRHRRSRRGGALAHPGPRRPQRRPARTDRARASGIATRGGGLMAVDRSRLPGLGPEPAFTFPEIRRRTLANGIRVLTVEHREVPIVSALALVPSGASADPPDRPGLAAITGDLLDDGCGDLDALALHDAVARIGGQIETEVGADATLVGMTALERFAPRALALLAEMAIRPRLELHEFTRVRDLRLNRLMQLRDVPPAIAERTFTRLLYGPHPYGHQPIGSEESLALDGGGGPRIPCRGLPAVADRR